MVQVSPRPNQQTEETISVGPLLATVKHCFHLVDKLHRLLLTQVTLDGLAQFDRLLELFENLVVLGFAASIQALQDEIVVEERIDKLTLIKVRFPLTPEGLSYHDRAVDRKSTRLNSSHLGISYAA